MGANQCKCLNYKNESQTMDLPRRTSSKNSIKSNKGNSNKNAEKSNLLSNLYNPTLIAL